ncbi:MAG TPA: trypsin-like peptidase domain-containing protein [Jatrophihabitans sp.]|nr:trypsin-like peptidase domain-containing protein [Jatrophihabitans sp.]
MSDDTGDRQESQEQTGAQERGPLGPQQTPPAPGNPSGNPSGQPFGDAWRWQPPYAGPGQPLPGAPYGGPGQPPYGGSAQPPYGGSGQPPYAGQPSYGGAGHPPYGGQPPFGSAGQPPYGESARPSRPRRGATVAVAAAVAGAVVGAGVGVGTYAAAGGGNGSANANPLSVTDQRAPVRAPARSIAAVAAKLKPSVVTIDTVGAQGAGTGSGVILRSNGYILTNDHVVSLDGSAAPQSVKLTVVFDNGKQASARVVGTDPTDDLAVIKVNRSGLQPVTFANSSNIVVGQQVVAMGAPLGLSDTVTSGIVSALDRPVQAGNNGQAIFDAVQTDAAINPGNSGGPLVDLSGHVVGINSAIASTSSSSPFSSGQPGNIGIGFAIPSDEATRVASQLINTGKVSHAELGIYVSAAPGQNALAPTSGAGAKIARVKPNSPAQRAGLQAGDVITQVGDQRIDDPVSLIAAVRSHAPGQQVTVQLTRNGKQMTVQVTLAAQTGS